MACAACIFVMLTPNQPRRANRRMSTLRTFDLNLLVAFNVLMRELNVTRAAERQSSPGYTMSQLWSEFGDFVEFSKTPVPQQDRLMENEAIVRFP